MRYLFLASLLFINNFFSTVMATEEPEFKLISEEGEFQIREYDPKIIAQVEVEGDFDEASSVGFKLLADYIFGNNLLEGESQKISMTTPVEMSPMSENFLITSPVMDDQVNDKWLMNFVMPQEYSLDTLPKPNNPQVKIIEVPKEKYAVILFSGLVREFSYSEKVELLHNYLEENGLKQQSAVKIARYNPPWTLPFFRRNELMVRID
ncbi:heme-binding protein [Methylophilales bacterium MBRSG12]|uniref:Heme-binding protein n=1 Tax=Methylophilales bacterium MBRS-H7 TaxID=1623450 RepID=A0A0H4IYZ7_9PROT|nr:heme-binding protein [Methylophilales bacterium MBRSF5]AKO66221.1 heme-binding protein [Methylophilales bacterium MBRS-H7]AKO67539.1 heme-binding protein [Methylophilales bacterium MBRSG12]